MGMTETFDEVFATSAGAMNAAYFLSGQADMGISIYYEDLADRAFINPWRFWKIVNVDYVFDHVVIKSKPLDLEKLRGSPTRFFAAVIDRDLCRAMLVDVNHGSEAILTSLKAATAVPVLYDRCVLVDGKRCMDGGLLNPFPIQDAIRQGCTDILVLLTRPADYVCAPINPIVGRLLDLVCSGGNQKLWTLFQRNCAADRAARNLAFGKSDVPAGVNIATICPNPSDQVDRTATDPHALWKAAFVYGERTLRLFGRSDIPLNIAPPREV